MYFFSDLFDQIYPYLMILIWVFGSSQIHDKKSESPSRYQPISVAFNLFLLYGITQVIPKSFYSGELYFFLLTTIPQIIHLIAWGFLIKGLLMKEEPRI